MTTVNRLTEEQIEKLAVEIRQFLIEHGLWEDVDIYFNGKSFTTYDEETKKYYYNDPEHLIVLEDEDPNEYFSYAAEDHILSMTFTGPLYNWMKRPQGLDKFNQIFTKYGLYYELGDSWNLSCYYV